MRSASWAVECTRQVPDRGVLGWIHGAASAAQDTLGNHYMHTFPDLYLAAFVAVLFMAGVASIVALVRERQRWKKKLERKRD